MKKSIRTLFSLLLVLTMVLSLCGSALAAESTIKYLGLSTQEDGSKVGNFTFTGSVYTDSDLFNGFKGVMPGDVLTQTVKFENAATDSDYVKVYMAAVPHDESNPITAKGTTETLTSMNDFLNQLNLVITNAAGEEIFNGHPNAAMNSTYIGTAKSGESFTFTATLTVPIELDNEYAHRLGEVDWKFVVEAFNVTDLSVRKVWSDGNDKHADESITVNLLKNGQVEQTVELNAENGWAYTFYNLDEDFTWTVEEVEVPEGYTVTIDDTNPNDVVITNTKNTPPTPPTPPKPNPPTPPKPTPPQDEPVIEEPETSDIYVTKVWEDDGVGRPGTVTLNLLKNGVVFDTVTISESTGWAYAWTELEDGYNWTVEEANVPEGYEVSYSVNGDQLTITNSKLKNITVSKVWSGDDEKSRPGAVTVTLYDGETAVETVQLSQDNGWSHTWSGLSAKGNWQVTETSIPKGYTPSYSVSGDVVTVTNTATLIQTGQLNWPIPVMAGCGVLLLALACMMLRKKKKA